MKSAERVTTHPVAPGVRLHLVKSGRFATTWCRVALVRDLGPEATRTAVLAACLQAACAASPTREALSHRLADLGGAGLAVRVAKPGDAQLLVAALEWPTAYVTRGEGALAAGLALLGDVVARPLREGPGREALDAGLVALETQNHGRALAALADDRPRLALRRLLELTCRDEPYGLDVLGRLEDLPGVTPRALGRTHTALVRRAPVEVFLVGDVGARDAVRLIRRHLLWTGRAARPRRLPRVVGVDSAPRRPRRRTEHKPGAQARLALSWRAPVRPSSPLFPAALVLTGVLGGGSYARLFKVLREEHGLCYDAHAAWHAAKGLLTVETGVDPGRIDAALRVIRALVREVAAGRYDPRAREGFRQAVRSRVATLRDDRAAMVGGRHEALLLGRDPSPEALRRALEAVGPSELRRVGQRLLPHTTYVLAPDGEGA